MPGKINKVSIIVPVYEEEENLHDLFEKLDSVIADSSYRWEVILINDGSKDRSGAIIAEKSEQNSNYVAVQFRRNFGQTAAMQAGFDHASGDVMVPLDADLQNDPSDIPMLLDKLSEGFDVVSGWRKNRKDKKVKRVLLSRIANALISKISGVKLHDYGCSLKAYRKSVMEEVRLYGEMHRFIPIYAAWQGGKITEMPVKHYPRTKGESKYGMERVFKVILDLIVVKFLHGYSQKPMYVFGGFGMFFMSLSVIFGGWAIALKVAGIENFSRTPLPLACMFFGLVGFFSILLGLLAEIIMRTYYESQNKKTYRVVRNSEVG